MRGVGGDMLHDAKAFVAQTKADDTVAKTEKIKRYDCKFTCTKKCRFRYYLKYCWNASMSTIVLIGLNPSTADYYKLDPTLYRVLYYSYKWGFGSFVMLNAYAHVSTDPHMLHHKRSVGRYNDATIKEFLSQNIDVVCAWSNCGRRRQNELAQIIGMNEIYCLGVDGRGYPLHPSRKCDDLERHKMHFIEDHKGNSLAAM